MTENTERLAPIGDFLNEQIQQPTSEIKVKEKTVDSLLTPFNIFSSGKCHVL